MVHRSVIGSLDRMLAHLIDTHGGAFPPWLAPTQLAVLPVSDDQLEPAGRLAATATASGLRAELDAEGSLGARIRRHHLAPYQAIIGRAEASAGEVSLRLRDGNKLPSRRSDEAISQLACLISSRSPRL
jgi:threonyl-tRNA synthetase